MPIDLSFPPNAARAWAIDARMHRELAASLDHLREEAAGAVAFDSAALAGMTQRLRGDMRVSPFVFADYYDLVIALLDDDAGEAERLFKSISSAIPWTDGLRIDALGADDLSAVNDRIFSMMNADASLELGFAAPEPDIADAFRRRLADGFALLDAAIPELAGEIRAIIRHLIIAGSDKSKKYQFDGGSHFQLWGALFLNANYHPDRVAVAEVLAHETAHSLLFGFCTDEPLANNSDDELYSSPLRSDPRPMDGIYHATFVSARMHWAMSRLAESDVLDQDERARARAAAASDLVNFDRGYGVVAGYAELTATGAALMQGAKDYMESVR